MKGLSFTKLQGVKTELAEAEMIFVQEFECAMQDSSVAFLAHIEPIVGKLVENLADNYCPEPKELTLAIDAWRAKLTHCAKALKTDVASGVKGYALEPQLEQWNKIYNTRSKLCNTLVRFMPLFFQKGGAFVIEPGSSEAISTALTDTMAVLDALSDIELRAQVLARPGMVDTLIAQWSAAFQRAKPLCATLELKAFSKGGSDLLTYTGHFMHLKCEASMQSIPDDGQRTLHEMSTAKLEALATSSKALTAFLELVPCMDIPFIEFDSIYNVGSISTHTTVLIHGTVLLMLPYFAQILQSALVVADLTRSLKGLGSAEADLKKIGDLRFEVGAPPLTCCIIVSWWVHWVGGTWRKPAFI